MFEKGNGQNKYYSEIEIIRSTRVLSIMSALLFLLFAIVDIWAIPSVLSEVLVVRGVVIACLLLTFSFTYASIFYKYNNLTLVSIFLITSMGIEYMIYKATPADYAYSVYFIGLVLILMTLYSWTYIKFKTSLLITSIVMGVYVYIEKVTRPIDAVLSSFELATNIFFISTAVVIGIVARLMRDRFILENIQLHQSLSEALHNKTEEADDYEHQANHDALTGLPNRRYATQRLEESLEIAKAENKALVMMFIDLNGFKQINDVYGHAAGDEVLLIIAKRLELAIRRNDCLARLGGDEYLIGFMIEKENQGEVEQMAENLMAIIAAPMNVHGTRIKVGASIGISAYPIHGNKVSVLMDIADKKMYQVKRGYQELDKNKKELEPVVIFPGNKKRRQG